MPITTIEKFYQYVTPKDFTNSLPKLPSLNEMIKPDTPANKQPGIVSFLQDLVVEGRNNGFPGSQDMLSSVSEILTQENVQISDEDLSERFFCVTDVQTEKKTYVGDFKGMIVGKGNKESKIKHSSFLLGTQKVSINLKNTNDITTFCKAIPTIELSRCVPYLNVRFVYTGREEDTTEGRLRDSDGRLATPSLLKFLNGGSTVTRSADLTMTDPKNDLVNGEALTGNAKAVLQKGRGASGMDMFTAPQTLQNLSDPVSSRDRYNPVNDPMRPFMSIEGLDINVVSMTNSLIQYKTAALALKLHDRSRLSEIANLIKPDVFGRTMLDIEYGWSHPGGDGNAYGEFMNRQRIREIYMIRSAGYSFDAAGQMGIKLDLAMKGATEMQRVKISESVDTNVKDREKELEELTSKIKDLRTIVGLENVKDPRTTQILQAAERGDKPNEMKNFDEELQKFKKSFQTAVSNNKGNAKVIAAATELLTAMDKLYVTGKDASKKKNVSLKESIRDSIAQSLKVKYESLTKGEDPFLPSEKNKMKMHFPYENKTDKKNAKNNSKEIVSFAKLFSVYCVDAIKQSIKDEISEVQVFFYVFSAGAGKASGTSIGLFPINVSRFVNILEENTKKNMSADMSVQDFLSLVNEKFFADPRSPAYGIADLYMPIGDKEKEPEMNKKASKDENAFIQTMDNRLQKYGGMFKQPTIKIIVETQPKRLSVNSNAVSKNETIMRIHVFDSQANVYDDVIQVLKSLTLSPAAFLSDSPESKKEASGFLEALKKETEVLQKAGFEGVTISSDKGEISVEGNLRAIKRAVTRLVPTITYGTNNSMITELSLTTQPNPLLAASAMRSQSMKNGAQPSGAGSGGIPMMVIPGELSMSTYGCALASIGQSVFVDLGTGTMLDTMYYVTGFSHKIYPGTFTSSWKLTWNDAYPAYTSFTRSVDRTIKLLKQATK